MFGLSFNEMDFNFFVGLSNKLGKRKKLVPNHRWPQHGWEIYIYSSGMISVFLVVLYFSDCLKCKVQNNTSTIYKIWTLDMRPVENESSFGM